MKNVARVDPKTNQLMYNPTYDEMYIPKVLYFLYIELCACVSVSMYHCVY